MFFTSFKSICNCCKPSKIYGREGAAQVSIKVISSPNKTYVPVRSLCCKSKSSIRYRCEDNCSTFSSLPLLSYCMFLLYAKIEKGRKRKLVFCLFKVLLFRLFFIDRHNEQSNNATNDRKRNLSC